MDLPVFEPSTLGSASSNTAFTTNGYSVHMSNTTNSATKCPECAVIIVYKLVMQKSDIFTQILNPIVSSQLNTNLWI